MSKKWYEKNGKDGDVVISTRIRFARNLEEYPFPIRCSKDIRQKITEKVKDAVLNSNSVISSRFSCINVDELDPSAKVSLVERHLASPEFISDNQDSCLLLLDDESVSVMINEEDHIRLQVMQEGFELDKAYELATRLDTLLDERLNFAFSDKLGYLTQCPTNLGTGMRASVMLHLPALRATKAMRKISENLSKLGLTIRGAFGEGSDPVACMYQLSNQITLGISEKTAIENLKSITTQLIRQELSARETLAKEITIQDKIFRSYGILQNARLLSGEEALNHLSNIRMGITTNLITNISLDTVNRLIVETQPATLIRLTGKPLDSAQRDKIRAEVVRKEM